MAAEKLTDDDRRSIATRVGDGEKMTELAKEYGVTSHTIKRAIRKIQGAQPLKPAAPPVSVTDFRSQVRKKLWREDKGSKKVQYNKWEAKMEALIKGGMPSPQAVIQASKDFSCLKPIFESCDMSGLDPHPGSHSDIKHGSECVDDQIICEDKELSNRENLSWAIEAAGRKRGDKSWSPDACPNWAAFFLYRQALEDPNNFTGKYLSVTGKSDSDEDDEQRRKSGKRSINEINEMLETLNQKPEGEEA